MSNRNINISLSTETIGYAENTWLRIEQEKPPADTATIGEVAAVIDSFYKTSPCGENEEPVTDERNADGTAVPPVTEEEINETLASLLPPNVCLFNDKGQYECNINVYRSDITKPYKLVVVDGEINQTTKIQKKIVLRIKVKGSSYIDLKYPVVGGFTAVWVGTAKDSEGAVSKPDIVLQGSVIAFDSYYTGTISASFMTEYDTVNIFVKGVTDEKESSRVVAFYEGLVDELDTEIPEADESQEVSCIGGTGGGSVTCTDDHTCYQITRHYSRCDCTGSATNFYETAPVEITCPKDWCFGGGDLRVKEVFDGYTRCDEQDKNDHYGGDRVQYWTNDPEYYEEKCCHGWPFNFPMPRCESVTSSYNGDPGSFDKDFYRGLYGERTQFVAVYPDDPEGCGELTVKQFVPRLNCCDEVTHLAWDDENSVEVIFGSGDVYVTGGTRPISWTVRGNGFYLDDKFTTTKLTTSSGTVRIYIKDDACGSASVVATDGCTSTSSSVRSPAGSWQYIDINELPPGHIPIGGATATDYSFYFASYDTPVTLYASSGRYLLTQTYFFGSKTVSYKTGAAPCLCGPVSEDWESGSDEINALHVMPDDETEIVSRSSAHGLMAGDNPQPHLWRSQYLYLPTSPFLVASSTGIGFIRHCHQVDADPNTLSCSTEGGAIYARGSTNPLVQEWKC